MGPLIPPNVLKSQEICFATHQACTLSLNIISPAPQYKPCKSTEMILEVSNTQTPKN